MQEYWYCEECDAVFADAAGVQLTNRLNLTIAAEPLTYVAAVEPACHLNGCAEYWYCEECDAVFADAAGVQLTNRRNLTIVSTVTLEHHEAVAVTCTEDGMQEYWYCAECDCYYTDAEGKLNIARLSLIVPATGHNYVNGFCSVCGDANNPFVDVVAGAYYYDAVLWAAEKGIANGITDTQFAPEQYCTRAMAVTLLWRAAGSPAPSMTVNPFTDVEEGTWYYDAVLWAVEKGITNGYAGTTRFGVEDTCTRAHIVTFLYRYAGKPAVSGLVNNFSDVAAGEFYTDAVLWAASEGIALGYDGTAKFGTYDLCTRGAIVTFLYRYCC